MSPVYQYLLVSDSDADDSIVESLSYNESLALISRSELNLTYGPASTGQYEPPQLGSLLNDALPQLQTIDSIYSTAYINQNLTQCDDKIPCKFSSNDILALLAASIGQSDIRAAVVETGQAFEEEDELQSWYDAQLEQDLMNSPFFQSDAYVDWIEPRAVFENRNSTVSIKTSSRNVSELTNYDYYEDVILECSLYDLEFSSLTPKLTQECRFKSSSLDRLEMRLRSHSLKSGSYHL